MTQASQQLPSWLTLSSTLLTEPDGSVSTSFATLRLPLTYFGPSIPLGTDGVWTYGGLTPPPSTSTATPTATPAPSTTPSLATTTPPLTPTPTSSPSGISASLSSSASSVSPSSSTGPVPGALASHGVSTAVLGAILGSILGVLLLIVIILILLLLRRNRRRSRASAEGAESGAGSSSFWNRQTTLFTFRRNDDRRQTPIWTGWEFIDGDGSQGSRGSRNGGRESPVVPHSPGEGSPRGSGDEADPFLTRRSLRSATLADETQTKSDTLVSMPAAAVIGTGTTRSSPQQGGHIIPRDVLARMAEHEPSQYDIRIVEPSPPQDQSPLLPPPPLNPDSLTGFGVRTTPRRHSERSVASRGTHDQSIHSEKSGGSLETDPAELLVARRVQVGNLTPSRSRLATIDSAGEPSTSRGALGLSGLGARLGRLSWFKRISSSGASTSPAETRQDTAVDPYTRTPPRSIRHGSHSRPGSLTTRLLDDADVEAASSPTNPRRDSGLGLGLLTAGVRPISSVSARSAASAGGNTVYHSARSRPASSVVEFPEPVTSPEMQERLSQAPHGSNPGFDGSYNMPFNPPPAYDDRTVAPARAERPPSEIDILDIPAPGPVSPFTAGRPAFPPGLVPLPQPRSWRDSYETDGSSPSGSSGAGIAIDILDEEPPAAREGWRDLGSERDGRRRTFGMPTVVEQQDPMNSQHPSLHSIHSHLRPQGSRSGTESAPSSGHSQGGSASSRPSVQSHLREPTGSSGQSLSIISSEESRNEGVVRSPPLSAVRGSMATMQSTRPLSVIARRASQQQQQQQQGPPPYITPASSRAPLLGGTVNSATSTGTNTNSSVTTALTDPITGAVLHFPSLPWSRGTEDPTGRRLEPYDDEGRNQEDHW